MNLLEKAIKFAEEKHAGQFRKDGITPYIEHPRSVLSIAHNKFYKTFSMNDYAVCILHDTMEDCGVTWQCLESEFNAQVADGVLFLTKHSSYASKKVYYESLSNKSFEIKSIKLCDRLANLYDTLYLSLNSKNRSFASYYIKDTIDLLDLIYYKDSQHIIIPYILDTMHQIERNLYV